MVATISFQDYLENAGPLPILIGLFVLGIPTILGSVVAILNIRAHFRKAPPDHEKYATKTELITVETRLKQTLSETEARLSTQLGEGERLFQSIQRELATIAAQTAEVRGYLKSLSESLNRPPAKTPR